MDGHDTRSETLGHRRPRAACSCCRWSSSSGWRCRAGSEEAGAAPRHGRHAGRVAGSASTATRRSSPGIVDHWNGSTHAEKGVGCVDCHQAEARTPTPSSHYGAQIATIVTPRDCAPLPPDRGGRVRARATTPRPATSWPRSTTSWPRRSKARACRSTRTRRRPGKAVQAVNGMAPRQLGLPAVPRLAGRLPGHRRRPRSRCDDLKPDDRRQADQPRRGRPHRAQRERQAAASAAAAGPTPASAASTSTARSGSCSACHSRHDFSPRRARQPENCGKCHLGPDHPQKEIYEESKHGVAFRDLHRRDEPRRAGRGCWARTTARRRPAPPATCARNIRNGMKITHDPGERISWTNRPPVSLVMDTDANHAVVTETDPEKRRAADRRHRRGQAQPDEAGVLALPHAGLRQRRSTSSTTTSSILYNEKFAKPGQAIMSALASNSLLTKTQFDEEIEWTWYLPLAPRRPARAHGRLDDGARLHPLARHVRGGRALLHGAHPRGARDHGRRRCAPGAPSRRGASTR